MSFDNQMVAAMNWPALLLALLVVGGSLALALLFFVGRAWWRWMERHSNRSVMTFYRDQEGRAQPYRRE